MPADQADLADAHRRDRIVRAAAAARKLSRDRPEYRRVRAEIDRGIYSARTVLKLESYIGPDFIEITTPSRTDG